MPGDINTWQEVVSMLGSAQDLVRVKNCAHFWGLYKSMGFHGFQKVA